MNTMTCLIYQAKAGNQKGRWRWRLSASNGRTIADSAEGYTRKSKAEQAFGKIVSAILDHRVAIKSQCK